MTEQQYPHAQNQPYGPGGGPGTQYVPQPPGAPWQQAPAPDKKRSWFSRHKILTGLGVLVLLVIVISAAAGGGSGGTGSSGSGSGVSGPGDSDSSGGGTTGKKAAKSATIGKSVRDGKFEFTVTKVKCGVASVGPDGFGKTAQGQFCMVSLKVTNIGDKAQLLDASSMYAYDAEGRKLSADSAAGIYANPAGGGAFLNEINPGNTATAVIVFDIPKTGIITRLELHDSAFSGGVDVAVK